MFLISPRPLSEKQRATFVAAAPRVPRRQSVGATPRPIISAMAVGNQAPLWIGWNTFPTAKEPQLIF